MSGLPAADKNTGPQGLGAGVMSLQVYARTHPRLRRQRIIIPIIIASMTAVTEEAYAVVCPDAKLIVLVVSGLVCGAKLYIYIETAKLVRMF